MTGKTLMHVKLEFEEARENKKEVLSLEIGILKMLSAIKKYHELRLKELDNKRKINTQLKKISLNVTKMKKIIPNVQIPKKYSKKTEEVERVEKPITVKRKKSEIEYQLQKIQERLKSLDQKF